MEKMDQKKKKFHFNSFGKKVWGNKDGKVGRKGENKIGTVPSVHQKTNSGEKSIGWKEESQKDVPQKDINKIKDLLKSSHGDEDSDRYSEDSSRVKKIKKSKTKITKKK